MTDTCEKKDYDPIEAITKLLTHGLKSLRENDSAEDLVIIPCNDLPPLPTMPDDSFVGEASIIGHHLLFVITNDEVQKFMDENIIPSRVIDAFMSLNASITRVGIGYDESRFGIGCRNVQFVDHPDRAGVAMRDSATGIAMRLEVAKESNQTFLRLIG